MKLKTSPVLLLFVLLFSVLLAGSAAAETTSQPFILALVNDSGPEQQASAAEDATAEPIWIDVRSADEYNGGHVSQAVNIPHTQIAEGISKVTTDKDALIYVYCRSGHRAGIAKETLDGLGYTQVINVGGFEDAMKKSAEEAAH